MYLAYIAAGLHFSHEVGVEKPNGNFHFLGKDNWGRNICVIRCQGRHFYVYRNAMSGIAEQFSLTIRIIAVDMLLFTSIQNLWSCLIIICNLPNKLRHVQYLRQILMKKLDIY